MVGRSWKTVKVFVSSTFRDMGAERDVLVKQVFPAVRERLEPFGIELHDIDLRWGITKDDVDDGRVLELCLSSARECRPFFVGLLGELYGTPVSDIEPQNLASSTTEDGMNSRSVTEAEIVLGALQDPQMARHAIFYFRDPAVIDTIPTRERESRFVERESQRGARLIALKEKIRESDALVRENYPAIWNADKVDPFTLRSGTVDGLDTFAMQVSNDLFNVITSVLELKDSTASDSNAGPFGASSAQHIKYAKTACSHFVGRDCDLRSIMLYLDGGDCRPLVILGDSGVGKTAFLGHVWETTGCGSSPAVFAHFVGANGASFRFSDFVSRLRFFLETEFSGELALPEPYDDDNLRFQHLIGAIPERRKLIILVDSLTDFDAADKVYKLEWLPSRLPDNVRIVCSSRKERSLSLSFEKRNLLIDQRTPLAPTQDADSYVASRGFLQLDLEPLPREEAAGLIESFASITAKRLNRSDRGILLDLGMSGNPLFLTVVLDELRLFGAYNHLDSFVDFIRETMSRSDNQDVFESPFTPLFCRVINRLRSEYTEEVVSRVLVALGCTRQGLYESELYPLAEGIAEPSEIPLLLRQLRPYLYSRDGLISIRFESLRMAIHFLISSSCKTVVISYLIDLFRRMPACRRKAEEYYELLIQGKENCYDSLIDYLLGDLETLRLAWENDHERVDRFWRAAMSGEQWIDTGKILHMNEVAGEKLLALEDEAHEYFAASELDKVMSVCRQAEVLALLSNLNTNEFLITARLNIMIVQIQQGEPDEAVATFQACKKDCLGEDDEERVAHALFVVILTCIQTEALRQASVFVIELLDLIEREPFSTKIDQVTLTTEEGRVLPSALNRLGHAHVESQKFTAAEKAFYLQSRLLRIRSDFGMEAEALYNAANSAGREGRISVAYGLYRQSLGAWRKSGVVKELAMPLNGMARSSRTVDECRETLCSLRECLETCENPSMGEGYAGFVELLDAVYIVLSSLSEDEAQGLCRELDTLAAVCQRVAEGWLLPVFLLRRADGEGEAGALRAAVSHYQAARACSDAPIIVAHSCLKQAETMKSLDMPKEALQNCREGLRATQRGEGLEELELELKTLLNELEGKSEVALCVNYQGLLQPGRDYPFLVIHPEGIHEYNAALIFKSFMKEPHVEVVLEHQGIESSVHSILGIITLGLYHWSQGVIRCQEPISRKALAPLAESGILVLLDTVNQAEVNCVCCQTRFPANPPSAIADPRYTCPHCTVETKPGGTRVITTT